MLRQGGDSFPMKRRERVDSLVTPVEAFAADAADSDP
jgi:hypothetical protein